MALAKVFTIKLWNEWNLKSRYDLKTIYAFSDWKCTNYREKYGRKFITEFSTYFTVYG